MTNEYLIIGSIVLLVAVLVIVPYLAMQDAGFMAEMDEYCENGGDCPSIIPLVLVIGAIAGIIYFGVLT